MLYYLVKYRCIAAFIIGALIGWLIVIPIDGEVAYIILAIAMAITILAGIIYELDGYKLICNHVNGMLKKYKNNPKKFNYFYKEFVSSSAICLIDSVMKTYNDLGITDKDVYTKLSKYKSFIRRTKAVSYDEAINVLSIATLFDEHIQLINEVYYKSKEIDVALKKVLEEKDDKLAKILEDELATKPKDLKKVGEYYS